MEAWMWMGLNLVFSKPHLWSMARLDLRHAQLSKKYEKKYPDLPRP